MGAQDRALQEWMKIVVGNWGSFQDSSKIRVMAEDAPSYPEDVVNPSRMECEATVPVLTILRRIPHVEKTAGLQSREERLHGGAKRLDERMKWGNRGWPQVSCTHEGVWSTAGGTSTTPTARHASSNGCRSWTGRGVSDAYSMLAKTTRGSYGTAHPRRKAQGFPARSRASQA